MLTFLGVSATNQNDWQTAKKDFLEAYHLSPNSAFSLNNLGYVAEKDGDLETAQFYYSKARKAEDANARVGLATQASAEGQQLLAVADHSNRSVDVRLDQYSEAQRQQTGPVELIPRGDSATPEPGAPPINTSPQPANPETPQKP